MLTPIPPTLAKQKLTPKEIEAKLFKKRGITPEDLFVVSLDNGDYTMERYSKSQILYRYKGGAPIESIRSNPFCKRLVMEILRLQKLCDSAGVDYTTS
jgi:hypothetical protein